MSGNDYEWIDEKLPGFRDSVGEDFYGSSHDEQLDAARAYLGVGEDADGIRQASYLVSRLQTATMLEVATRAAIPAIMVRNRCQPLGSRLTYKLTD